MRNGRRGDCIDDGQFYDSLHGGLVSANAPPVADAGPNQPSVPSGATVQLAGGATDPEGDPTITYEWRFVAVPEASLITESDLSDQTDPAAIFSPDVDGTYVLILIAHDGNDPSPPDVVVVTVPEPGMGLMLAAGAGLLAAMRRRAVVARR